jgi:hypothetical protein
MCRGTLCPGELSRLLPSKACSVPYSQSLCEATRTPKEAILCTCRCGWVAGWESLDYTKNWHAIPDLGNG